MRTTVHWLMRAADARMLADEMPDPEAKQSVLAIADGYERLAQHAASMAEDGGDISPSPCGRRERGLRRR